MSTLYGHQQRYWLVSCFGLLTISQEKQTDGCQERWSELPCHHKIVLPTQGAQQAIDEQLSCYQASLAPSRRYVIGLRSTRIMSF